MTKYRWTPTCLHPEGAPGGSSLGSMRAAVTLGLLSLASAGCGAAESTDPAVDDTACLQLPSKTVCDPEDPAKVFTANGCGEVFAVRSTCLGDKVCVVQTPEVALCAVPPNCTTPTTTTVCVYPDGLRTLYEESYVAASAGIECIEEANEKPGELVESCGFGSACFQEPDFNGGEALCHRSIDASQADKPYYDFGCSRFSLWMRHPTSLEMDCRCRTVGDGQGGAGGEGSAYADPNNIDITNGARPGGPIINCASSNQYSKHAWPVQYGEGPSFAAWYDVNNSGASWYSGAVDPVKREMYGLVRWSDPNHSKGATVVAWDLDTKDRRVVSGLHPGGEYGSGYLSPPPQGPFPFGPQPLTGGSVIRLGPDGMLYVAGGGSGDPVPSDQRQIVRVDPVTGERTLAWMAQETSSGDLTDTWGQCFRPDAYGNMQSVGILAQAFEVGPDGTFYMSFSGIREGKGIISVSSDGSTCTFLSRWGGEGDSPGGGTPPDPAPAEVGDGPFLQFYTLGLLFHDGLIYGTNGADLYSFDPATGDCALVSYVNTTFQGIGVANVFWDPTREVVWAVGDDGKYLGAIIDPKTGRREAVFGDTGRDDFGDEAILRTDYDVAMSLLGVGSALSDGNVLGNGGVVLDPDDPDILYGALKSGALVKLELSTFNSYIYSY